MIQPKRRDKAYPIVDCDVHHMYPSVDALTPYLPKERAGAVYFPSGINIGNPRGPNRRDAERSSTGVPASSPDALVRDHMDRYDIDLAVLNPGSTLGLPGIPDIDLAADIAKATNEWTIEEWLPADERFLGSILVAPRDPVQAAAEIRRLGANPRMVQVTMTAVPTLMGARSMDPIWEAANEFELPVNLHVGGGDAGINPGSYPVGFPTSFFEYHIGMCIPGLYHVVSVIAEGVFERYPKTRLVLNEFGIAWMPFLIWRMDMEYRSNRDDIPLLPRQPSEYVMDFIRFSTQPLELPLDKPERLVDVIRAIDGEKLLVFATDYPHWDFDNPNHVLKDFPPEWRARIFYENAWELYRLKERLGIDLPTPIRETVAQTR